MSWQHIIERWNLKKSKVSIFLWQNSKNNAQIQNFMKIRPVDLIKLNSEIS